MKWLQFTFLAFQVRYSGAEELCGAQVRHDRTPSACRCLKESVGQPASVLRNRSTAGSYWESAFASGSSAY